MNVIISGKVKLYSKGADVTMFERLRESDENKRLKQQTEQHLKEFAELVTLPIFTFFLLFLSVLLSIIITSDLFLFLFDF
jgi:hypothetical protein